MTLASPTQKSIKTKAKTGQSQSGTGSNQDVVVHQGAVEPGLVIPDQIIPVHNVESRSDLSVKQKKQGQTGQEASQEIDSISDGGQSLGVDSTMVLAGDVGIFTEEPIQLAQAETGAAGASAGGAAAGAATGAATTTAATTAATATAAGAGISVGLVAAGAVGVAAVAVAASSGGGSSSSTSSSAADTTPPTLDSIAVSSSGNNKIVLTFSENLDATNVPDKSKFSVTADGSAISVSSFVVSGKTVTLTLAQSLAAGQAVSVTYTDPTTGNDTQAIQDAAGNDVATVTKGFTMSLVSDGYVRGAQIYVDKNGNGDPDSGEEITGVTTNALGGFILPSTAPSGAIIAVGGINIDTGVPNTVVLKAPSGSGIISPITTLMQAIIEANTNTTVAQASAAVAKALGLDTLAGLPTDLTKYDPIATLSAGSDATALAVQKAATQLATMVGLATTGQTGSTLNANAVKIFDNLATAIGKPNAAVAIDLSNSAVITAAISGISSTVSATTIATKAAEIAAAADLETIVAKQAAALDTITPVKPTGVALTTDSDSGITGDNKTNSLTPTVRVSINTTATDGTAAVAGDTVSVLNSSVEVGSAKLTSQNIANGYVDIKLSSLTDGAMSLTAKVTDIAAHVSPASSSYTLTVDTQAPSLSISTVSGGYVNDSEDESAVTISGTTNAEDGQRVTVTLNGKTYTSAAVASGAWSASIPSADIKALTEGTVTVKADVSDAAGNSAAQASQTFVYDKTAPEITMSAISGGYINKTESESPVSVSGTSSAEDGQAVTVTIGSKTYQATVTAGVWTASVPSADIEALPEGSATVSASVSDLAGNAAQTSRTVIYDKTAPTLAINAISGGYVNDAEDELAVPISGTTNAEDGRKVTVGIGGNSYEATVSGGAWTTSVSSVEIKKLTEGSVSVTANVSDAAGNPATQATQSFVYDRTGPTLTITDDKSKAVTNIADGSTKFTFAFSEDIDVSSFTIDDITVTGGTAGTLTKSDNKTFTIDVTPTANTASGTIGVSTNAKNVTDVAGNVGQDSTQTQTQAYDTLAPTLTISAVSGGFVNNAEDESAVAISGTSSAEDGRKVTVGIGGNSYEATVSGGAWTTSVSSVEIKKLTEGSVSVTANVSDAAGNSATQATQSFVYDITSPTFSAASSVTGSRYLTLALSENSAGAPSKNDFSVTMGGLSNTVTGATLSEDGLSVVLTLTDAVSTANGAVVVSYSAGANKITDIAGNAMANLASSLTASVETDSIAPTIVKVYSSNAAGTYGSNSVIAITMEFSELVSVTGTPLLTLETGSKDQTASYVTGPVSKVLTFNYTVQPGDTASKLDYAAVSSLALSGGSIADLAGNNAVLTLPSLGGGSSLSASNIVIDGVSPTFTAQGATGGTKILTLTASEALTGTPDPADFDVVVNKVANVVTAVSVSGTKVELTLTSAIANNASVTVDYTSNASAGKKITDVAGNAMDSVGDPLAVTLTNDTVAPTVAAVSSSTANGTYGPGSVIAVTVGFSEPVFVTGSPQITLETGTIDRVATYASGSGTKTLTFNYTVVSGDSTGDLGYSATDSLALNGGAISDAAGNSAVLTLPSPGGASSLSGSKAIVIDGVAPTFTAQAATGGTKIVTLTASETVTGTPAAADFDVLVGGVANAVTAVTVSGTKVELTLTNAIVNNAIVTVDYSQGTNKITDVVGNNMASVGDPLSVSLANDTVAPTVQSFYSTTADGAYKSDAKINITATMSEDVRAGSSIDVTLNTGDKVTLTAGVLGKTLAGTYTVGAGDNTGDLNVVSYQTGTGGVLDVAGVALSSTGLPANQNLADNANIRIDTTPPFLGTYQTPLDGGGIVQKDGNTTANAGDQLVFVFNEAIGNKTTLSSLFTGDVKYGANATPASATWSTEANRLTVTLGVGETYSLGDYIALNGVQDIAGNLSNLTFHFV